MQWNLVYFFYLVLLADKFTNSIISRKLEYKKQVYCKKISCADDANDKISICQLTTGQKTRDKL